MKMKLFRLLILFICIFFSTILSKAQPKNCSAKEIEKTVAQINEKLYASKYEVTNLQYRVFISELQKANNTDLHDISLVDTINLINNLALDTIWK